jgi:hippurate hydrolase
MRTVFPVEPWRTGICWATCRAAAESGFIGHAGLGRTGICWATCRAALLAVWLFVLGTPTARADESADDPLTWVKNNVDKLGELYRELHAHPELSFHEEATAKRLAREWQSVGVSVTSGIGGHGIVGILENGDGPLLMLRCDMDGLPVMEQTRLTYSSNVRSKSDDGAEVGVMHACGHDIHMTNLVGVVRYLASHKSRWRGRLMLIGQPAEERGAGAKSMLEDGLFQRFGKPDFAVALHVDAGLAADRIGIRAGPTLANVDSVDIIVHGKGGHGAYPHTTVDPVVQAAELVMSLQTIVSREVSATEPAVITVGSIHGGTKHNVIGDSCHLQLTVRSYSDEVRKQLLDAISRKAKAVAAGSKAAEPTITVSEGTPSLSNDLDLVERIGPVFRRALGEDQVETAELSMGGEDFSHYGRAGVPILMYRLGSVDGQRLARFQQLGQQPPSLHSPLYYPDFEQTLMTGVSSMASAALELLPP